jgi:hypothetical protein
VHALPHRRLDPTIIALRTVILSRKRKHRPEPRLLRWVEGWIGWTGEAESLRVMSEDDGLELNKARRAARHVAGRGMRRERNQNVKTPPLGIAEMILSMRLLTIMLRLLLQHIYRLEGDKCFGHPPTDIAQESEGSQRPSRQDIASHLADSGDSEERRSGAAGQRLPSSSWRKTL